MFMGPSIAGLPPANGAVTVQVTTQATEASLTTNQTFTGTSAIMPQGAFSINGYTFNADGTTTTLQGVVNAMNAASFQTGVAATIVPNGGNFSIQLQSTQYGAKYPVNLYDSGHMLDTSTNPAPTVAGTDAVASVTVPVSTPTGPSTRTVTFQGGQGPTGSGLELTDSSGNLITLTGTGNSSAALSAGAGVGSLTTGSVRFQVGQNAGQNVSYSMPDAQTTQLGTGLFLGQSLSTMDVTSAQGASQALQMIDAAIDEVGTMRGGLGSFQSGLLQPNLTTLNTATQNLSASRSSIQDVDMASEMTEYTKNQIIQQSGLAMLAQSNMDPQKVLQLLQKN
jgi:flagellin